MIRKLGAKTALSAVKNIIKVSETKVKYVFHSVNVLQSIESMEGGVDEY